MRSLRREVQGVALLSALALGVGSTACASTRSTRRAADAQQIRVVVENTNWLEMTIYAQTDGGMRTRLGTVGTGETRTFRLSPGQTGGFGTFRLVADPIGSSALTTTQWLNAGPGNVALWKIGNSPASSYAMIR